MGVIEFEQDVAKINTKQHKTHPQPCSFLETIVIFMEFYFFVFFHTTNIFIRVKSIFVEWVSVVRDLSTCQRCHQSI